MKQLIALLFALTFPLAVAACSEEGPAEKAGRKIDEAFDEMRDGGEDALERAGDALDEAAEQIEEAAKDLERKVEDATD